ncbi:MAG TPA: toxin TcdB middle/C-terminal domain-containing protein, partial [Allosphingosinicella sp.]|nr:toxin TcdB middle/C-terminal domain-containing protein [Allosphingosinicella sp.]
GLSLEEEREACRALKGSMLRQEVYGLDGSAAEPHPYTVAEQNFTVRREQPRGANRHGVFFTHPREALTYHYERNPADPRLQHALTLEVDASGNVLKEAAIGYGRRASDLALADDRAKQTATLVTYSEHRFTGPVDDVALYPDDYRAPSPAESRTWELTGYGPPPAAGRFNQSHFVSETGGGLSHVFDGEGAYEAAPGTGRRRRLIEHVRTLYRADDLDGLLPLGTGGRLALAGETYKLAFTPGLLDEVYRRAGQALIPVPATTLGGQGGDRGGYLSTQELTADNRFPATDEAGLWWIPSGRSFLSPGSGDTAALELAYARAHFFLPLRFRDPFHSDAVSTEARVGYDSHDLLLCEAFDAVGNRTSVGERKADGTIDPARPGNDYRLLQPALVSDANRNRSAVAFDALGLVVATAIMGKPEDSSSDSLDELAADLDESVVLAHMADPLDDPWAILGRATTRLTYDLFAYQRSKGQAQPQPAAVYSVVRETHHADLAAGAKTKVQHGFSYSDGFGREIQKKIQAEPGPVVDGGPTVAPRWVGSGWTIFNNKGRPVRRYEPFFSADHGFEYGVATGVSPILFYDPAGRAVATLHPNHSYEKVLFDPWRQVTWDVNDTVLRDPRTDSDIAGLTARYFAALGVAGGTSWKTWHAQRATAALGAQEQAAAVKAAAHAATPTSAHFDSLGRPFLTLADCGPDPAIPTAPHRLFATRVELDIEGNQRSVRDSIEQGGDKLGRIVMLYAYDMLGNRIRQSSMEAGERWTLADAAGRPLRSWNSRGHDSRSEYDPSRRPLRILVTGTDAAAPTQSILSDRMVYGERHPDAEARNLRGKAFLHLDQAGAAATGAYDFKGNLLSASRRLTGGTRYRAAVDWSAAESDTAAFPADAAAPLDIAALDAALAPLLETDAYESLTAYDAMSRPVLLTTPHTPAMSPSRVRPGYNEANLLERVEVNLRGATFGGRPVWTQFVTAIDYDAKGQRRRIDYGNRVSTAYEHDPLTFRLTRLTSRRPAADFPNDCPRRPPLGWPGCQVQDLRYTYDPVGNITRIEDRAQQAIFFANRRVEPGSDYVYNPLYRLIEATGREHIGQAAGPIPHGNDDSARARLPQPGDGNAMAAYVESYVYDAVGNLLEMSHDGANPFLPGWTRHYAYAEASLIEDGQGTHPLKTGNRLSSTRIGDSGTPEPCRHDAHGNIVRMPHLGGSAGADNMAWDERDQLRRVDLGGGGEAFYVYDAAGQRVRKVWEKSAALTEERIYLGGFEIFRRRQGAQLVERETLHVMDDKQRIALVETRTVGTAAIDPAPGQLVRYQLGNHLGSASLELDDKAQIVSYEEYAPYGSTTYQAVRATTETPKRYRYTGKERDEESGFYYHGARYYAPWLARWT